MLFKKQKCSQCNAIYDPTNMTCPICGEPNTHMKKGSIGPGYIPLKWPYQLACLLVGTVGFGIIQTFVLLVIMIFTGSSTIGLHQEAWADFICYGILFGGMLAIFILNRETLIPHLSKKAWRYILGILLGFAAIGISELYGLFVNAIAPELGLNKNEEVVENIIGLYPVLSIIFIGILGPICEEFTYRLGMFSLLNRINRVLAYIVASFVFASAHFSITWLFEGDMNGLLVELLNFPSYLIAGVILTFSYDMLGLQGSCMAHITNNIYCIILVLLGK